MQTSGELRLERLVFQQNKHTVKVARKWFQHNKVNVLKWPSSSPDINPIEGVGAKGCSFTIPMQPDRPLFSVLQRMGKVSRCAKLTDTLLLSV